MEKNTKNVFRIILFIAGIAGILDTLVVSTFVNGMDLGVVLPLVIGVACIVWSLKPLYEKHLQKINPALRRITYWAFMLFLFFFIVVEGCIILGGIYIQNADVEPDYILVLGTGINADGSPSLTLENGFCGVLNMRISTLMHILLYRADRAKPSRCLKRRRWQFTLSTGASVLEE